MRFNKMLVKSANEIGKYAIVHGQEILTGFGIALWGMSTITAVSQTPKAVDKITYKKIKENRKYLTPTEIIKEVGKYYIVPAGYAIGGTLCLIASVNVGKKRYAGLAASYELLREAAMTYKEKVVETIGESKNDKINTAIAQDSVDKNPPTTNTIYITEKGTTLFKESLTGQYFRSDMNTVKARALDIIEQELTSPEQYVGVAEWLLSLGLEVPRTTLGTMGWSIANQQKKVNIKFRAVNAHKYNDEPCNVIEYDPEPMDDFAIYYGL